MDELKRSLEEAIKELQELPAAAPANPLPKTTTALPNGKKTILEQALAAGPVLTKVPDFGREPVLPSPPAPRTPAPNTIEAALAAAPAVSPHYVPPPAVVPAPREVAPAPVPASHEVAPAPVPASHEVAPAPVPASHEVAPAPVPVSHEVAPASVPVSHEVAPASVPVSHEVAPASVPVSYEVAATPVPTSREAGPARHEATLLAPLPPAARKKKPVTVAENPLVLKSGSEQERTAAVLARPAAQHLEIPAARAITSSTPVQDIQEPEKLVDLVGPADEQPKKQRDKIWRWATIGISCAGGLASGWLGSSFSDATNGTLQSSAQVIKDKASDKVGIKPPVNMKLVGAGKAAGTADHVTGKTDRAVPIDENHCTVLERDRGTGLTLAKPCKLIETAGFTSTLDKSDLLVKPR
ncbi:MAG: hypothetical protein L3J67_01940 [Hyphomicrobiaceae bacterium]|nr:hypothetical protein [Hyphomicrobiaceae bacterium]